MAEIKKISELPAQTSFSQSGIKVPCVTPSGEAKSIDVKQMLNSVGPNGTILVWDPKAPIASILINGALPTPDKSEMGMMMINKTDRIEVSLNPPYSLQQLFFNAVPSLTDFPVNFMKIKCTSPSGTFYF